MNTVATKVNTLAWAASSNQTMQLSNSGFITQLDLLCSVTLSATAAADLATFGLWRFVQNLTVQGGSGKVYFSMSGVQMGVLLHALNLYDYPGKTFREIVGTTQKFLFRMHFGTRPRDSYGRENPYDLTSAIPAMDETTVNLIWGTTGDDVMDDTITISSGTMEVIEYRALPVNPAQESSVKYLKNAAGNPVASKLMIPVSSSESYDPGATKSNNSGVRYVPSGNWVKRIGIAAQDDTAVGSFGPLFVSDQLTYLALKYNKANVPIVDNLDVAALQLSESKFDGMEVVDTPNVQSPWAPAGLYVLDLRQVGDSPDFGIDARTYGSNDLQLGLTIGSYAAGEVEQIFYEQYQPYPMS